MTCRVAKTKQMLASPAENLPSMTNPGSCPGPPSPHLLCGQSVCDQKGCLGPQISSS